jgi:hypothetical protein
VTRGPVGLAGEVVIKPSGPACFCGSRGCLTSGIRSVPGDSGWPAAVYLLEWTATAPNTVNRKRMVLNNAMEYARGIGTLPRTR